MGKFLTGRARLEQTDIRRIWKLLDNEIFKADDGSLYLTPRNFPSDCYTVPLYLCWLVGSPVDFDVRCSILHDELCYFHQALKINLNEKELRDNGFLRYSEKNKMWVCEDIPAEFLRTEKIGKIKANNVFYECMKACNVPLVYRVLLRFGVGMNLRWYLNSLFNLNFKFDFEKLYDEIYWEKIANEKYGN